MHLILTGATGLVGSATLEAMIKMKEITKISVISRRPVKMAEDAKDPRVNVILHQDFEKYDQALLDQVRDATGCVWALGISQTKVSKEEYVKITKDYALAAAKAFEKLPLDEPKRPFDFVFVSGEGTTHRPGIFTSLFGRVKGETELGLAAMRAANPGFRADAVRPAMVDWSAHGSLAPYLPSQGYLMGAGLAVLGPVLRTGFKGMCSPTQDLGRFLTECAMGKWQGRLHGRGCLEVGDSGFTVVENVGFRRLAGLDV